MGSHDFSNIVIRCQIENPDGSVLPLWVDSYGAEYGGSKFEQALPVVQELSVELNLGYLPKITAQCAFNYHDMIKFVESDAILWGASQLTVQFGYTMGTSAVLSAPFTGLLTKPDVRIGVESSITLTGIGYKGHSLVRQGRTYAAELKDKTRKEIIEWLGVQPIDNIKQGVKFDFSEVEKLGSGDPAYDGMFTTKISLSPSWKADWHLIMRLCRDGHCWLFFDGDTAKIIPINKRMIDPPRYMLAMFPQPFQKSHINGFIGPVAQIYPILEFNSPTTGVFYPPLVRGQVLKGIDGNSGKEFKRIYNNKKDDTDSEGSKAPNVQGSGNATPESGEVLSKGDTNTGSFFEPNFYDADTKPVVERIQSDFLATISQRGIQVEVMTVGIPEILPGESFALAGVSQRFCGTKEKPINYSVHNIIHTLGSGGFSTKVVAFTNSGWVREQASIAGGTLGNKPHDEGAGDSTDKQPGSAT